MRDAIVVGAGPAGSAAGCFLARGGMKPLVLERETFPRFAIGESLLPGGNGVLAELGILGELESAGFVKKFGADFCTGDGAQPNRFWFRNALGDENAQTYQVDRARFDHILAQRAAADGCEILEGAKVTGVSENGTDSVVVRFEHGGREHEETARWLIDASGREGIAGRLLEHSRIPTRDRKMVAIYGHFSGVQRESGEAGGQTVIVRFKEGWFWLIPLADGKTSVGVVIPPEMLRGHGGDLSEIFDSCVAANPNVAARMESAQALMPLRATADYSWRHRKFAARRVVFAGDAAGFVDPIFSSGVMLALKSGRMSAQMVLRADAAGRELSARECNRYTREVGRWMRLYGRIIASFYGRAGFEVFMHPMPFLGIPRSVGLLVGGMTELAFPERLRLVAFALVCRIQKVLNLVPPIPSLR